MHCSAVSGPEWDSIEKRQAGLAHRRKKEKEAQLSKGGKFLPGTAPSQPSAFEEVSSSPSSPGAPHTQTHSEQFYVIEGGTTHLSSRISSGDGEPKLHFSFGFEW